ncbi:hypothetical protein [Tautonia rosea]|uniref:hypothetical protein n=1 Tax=Tautonia rosea TaxID=2728037 RepID=UPI0014767876|nr:hypothetical protein [Tautonia rosea]
MLEERIVLSDGVPIPASNPRVPLSTIFWNGETMPLNPSGKVGVPSPQAAGAAKTITIKNNSAEMIYPFLRGGNFGKDPNSSEGSFYDPQDLTDREFRQYVGYADQDGSQYLGLPAGASITLQVPLVLWDGNNLYLATAGEYLTSDSPNLFNYEATAQIAVAGAVPVSGSVWVQDSSGFPEGQDALVMFYFFNGPPKTVPDDAPAQLTEITFRDPYLTQFITDPNQTFPLLNYDVSYVNNMVYPVSMAAGDVPITFGNTQDPKTPPKYFGLQDFGWLATNRDTTSFQAAIEDFVANRGAASIGAYFGPDRPGWPSYFAPPGGDTVIPSGANLFDDSPLSKQGQIVHPSSFDPNRWMLTSNGTGPIAARAGGVILTDPQATVLPLVLAPDERAAFVQTIRAMLSAGETVNLTIAPSTEVLGKVLSYDATDSVQAITVTNGGSGYSKADPPQVVLSGGAGQGAKAVAFVSDDGVITGIGLTSFGSGYTAPPTVSLVGGGGTGASATAAIGGGKVTVALDEGKSLPTGQPISYVFPRPPADYAITAITNLWYSWAQYYVQQYQDFAGLSLQATPVFLPIPGSGNTTTYVTNRLELATAPTVPLAVGMTVTGPGVSVGTTILSIDGTTIHLSQILDVDAATPGAYAFGKPTMFPYDPAYTQTFPLTFGPDEAETARLFAGSVYQAIASQSVDPPPSPYLPDAMNLVSRVIEFWAKLPGYEEPWGPTLVGETRDIVKSILRGVYDFNEVKDQSKWYPAPSTPMGGQLFNVYNLDPYVWFVHVVQGMSAYGFSVDDDVANPTATGPLLAADGTGNHFPNNLNIGFGGTGGLGNPNQWFPTTPWGALETMATISVVPPGFPYAGSSMVTFIGPDALKLYNQINNPGSGQVGASILSPGFIPAGTTLIFKGPVSGDLPQIVLSQNMPSVSTPIPVRIDAGVIPPPPSAARNHGFEHPIRSTRRNFVVAPRGPGVSWAFARLSGIAQSGSPLAKNNPTPAGSQVAFIRGRGHLRQLVRLQPNREHTVSFLVAQRLLDNGTVNRQTLQVRLGRRLIGTFTPSPSADGRFVRFTSAPFTVPDARPRLLFIIGTNRLGGDNTALIDEVVVS